MHIFQGPSKAEVSLPGTLGTRLEFEQVQNTQQLHAESQELPPGSVQPGPESRVWLHKGGKLVGT